MIVLAIGRCDFPAAALKYASPVDESDQDVIRRSHALPADVFHGLVELACCDWREAALLLALTDGGWKKYDPPRPGRRPQSQSEAT